MKPFTIKLNYLRETKNTYVFVNNEPRIPIVSCYVKKHGMPDGPPLAITLNIEEHRND